MKIINKIILILLITNCSLIIANAQNTAITDDAGYSPNSSAMLDVKSTDKGILIPRLTSAQRALVSSPATGLLVFDTDENNFYFYNGTSWVNLSSANANNVFGYTASDKVYLKDVNHNFGIGTTSPTNKLEVKADADNGLDQAIFNVVNNTGDTVFAVYQQGVRINVYDDPLAKAKSSKGGFAVGGFKPAKGITTNEYLRITPDSIRMYIEENTTVKAASRKGGFAVGGFKPAKATAPTDYFNIFGANSADVINPSQSRIFWYPVKEAFLAGRVLVESPDSVGTNSFASGFESRAIGNYSQALGYKTLAKGEYSTAIGKNSRAVAPNSFAFGDGAKAKADDSYAFGSGAEANGISSYAFGSAARDSVGNVIGFVTTASGRNSIAFGQGALAKKYNAMSIGTSSDASGDNSMAIGSNSTASGSFSTAFGVSAAASGLTSMALGNYANASGKNAVALGTGAIASGTYDVAIGFQSKATGGYSAALGKYSEATGSLAVAIGACTATGSPSLAMGINSESIGAFSTAIGGVCLSIADWSTAIGDWNKTYGDHSLATGSYTVANGTYSSSFGNYTNAKAYNSAVFGQYNDTTGTATSWIATEPLFIVANGTSNIARSNAMTILKNGSLGIGTATPSARLHVNSVVNEDPLLVQIDGVSKLYVNNNGGTSIGSTTIPSTDGLYVSGNVGIGAVNASYKLYVSNTASTTTGIGYGGYFTATGGSTSGTSYGIRSYANSSGVSSSFAIYADATGGGNTGNQWAFYGIGSGYFSGTVKATSFIATTVGAGAYKYNTTSNMTVPDYVFDKHFEGISKENPIYNMLSLGELKDYISKNRHLPRVPSREEIEKDGVVNLQGLSMINLEKTEENALYIIQLDEKINKLEKENESLKNNNKNLQQQIDEIKLLLEMKK